MVEVSDSTLDFDRGPKLQMYARGGVPEYWILNPIAGELERHRGPRADGTYAA